MTALERQLVPTDPEMWAIERYRDFLGYRRQKLVDVMNAFILEKSRIRSSYLEFMAEYFGQVPTQFVSPWHSKTCESQACNEMQP